MFCLTTAFFFSSPQLRMSFIVFSTEGRTLMALTEDRYKHSPPHLNALMIIFACLLCFPFLFSPSISMNIQRPDSGRTGGAEDGAARRRHLHAQGFSKGKPSANSMGNWSHTPNSMASDLLKWGSFEFIATDASKPLPQASEQIYYGTGDGELNVFLF